MDDNVAHAQFTLCTSGYKHTLILFSTYCFSTATLDAQSTSLLRSYVQGLSSPQLTKYVFCYEGDQVMDYEMGWSNSRPGIIRML
jgi:hypothetical protein